MPGNNSGARAPVTSSQAASNTDPGRPGVQRGRRLSFLGNGFRVLGARQGEEGGSGALASRSCFDRFYSRSAPTPGTRASGLHLSASGPDLPTHISPAPGAPTRPSERPRVGAGGGAGTPGPVRGSPVPLRAASRSLSGSQLARPAPRGSRAESAELKPGHGERKSYITGRSRERAATGTSGPRGGAGVPRAPRPVRRGRVRAPLAGESKRRKDTMAGEAPGPPGASPQGPPPPPTRRRGA